MGNMSDKFIYLLLFYPVLLFSLSFHEAAHGWMANRFGDPTARLLGRVTLNPLPHMDMIGTFILPVFAILTGAPLIGWGKPVPVNPMNLKDPRKDELWIAALGPLSNLALAVVFALLVRAELYFLDGVAMMEGLKMTVVGAIYAICRLGVMLNLTLAVFNLIPLYPLDGGGVIRGLLPSNAVAAYDAVIARYGMILLLVLFVTGLLRFIAIPVNFAANMLLP